MSKITRATGTAAHITIAVPLHVILSILTCGLWIPVWVYMSVQRKKHRQAEKIAEQQHKDFQSWTEAQQWGGMKPPDPYGPNVPFA